MAFKVGDKVIIVGGEGFDIWARGRECIYKTATVTDRQEFGGDVEYILNDNEWCIDFKAEWLKLAEEKKLFPEVGKTYKVISGDCVNAKVGPVRPYNYVYLTGVNPLAYISFDSQGIRGESCSVCLVPENLDLERPVDFDPNIKVGDMVRVIKGAPEAEGDHYLGRVGTVTRIDLNDNYPYLIDTPSDHPCFNPCFKASQIVKTPKPDLTATTADWLVATNTSGGTLTTQAVFQPIINKKGGFMSLLISIPKRIERLLNANQRNLYKLGWVDDDLSPTSSGREQLIDILWDEYEEKLGAVAKKEVARIKKEEKDEE